MSLVLNFFLTNGMNRSQQCWYIALRLFICPWCCTLRATTIRHRWTCDKQSVCCQCKCCHALTVLGRNETLIVARFQMWREKSSRSFRAGRSYSWCDVETNQRRTKPRYGGGGIWASIRSCPSCLYVQRTAAVRSNNGCENRSERRGQRRWPFHEIT